MDKFLIGIDIGGTNIKAAIFDISGNEISKSSRQTPVEVKQDVFHMRDMNLLWDKIIEIIKESMEKASIRPEQIAAIGTTGHGKGMYLWGKNDKPCYHGVPSTDRRAEEIVARWKADGTCEEARKLTLQNTLACQPVALLAWLKESEPEVYSNIKWIFEAKDYVRFMLTGKPYAEYTDTSGTSTMNLITKEYDKQIMEIYGIPEMFSCLPPLRKSSDLCGYVSEKAAIQTGLCAGTPVCGGMFDIDACAIAMDVSTPEPLCIVTGTWSINIYLSENHISREHPVNHSLFCVPGYYLIEESSPTSAGNLDWVLATLFGLDNPDYQEIDNQVNVLDPELSNVFFLPFLYGSNSDLVRNAVFAGLNSGHSRADVLRAVYEGVVFSHKYHIDKLLKHRDKPAFARVGGGGANSDVWMQMFADVLNINIDVVEGKELGAKGAAMAAAICTGIYTDYPEAANSMVRIRKTFRPNIAMHEKYLKKYETYKKISNGSL